MLIHLNKKELNKNKLIELQMLYLVYLCNTVFVSRMFVMKEMSLEQILNKE